MLHSIKIALVSSEIEDLTDMLEIGGTDASKKWLLAALVGLVGLLRRLRRSNPGREAKPVDSEDSEEGEESETEEDDDVDEQAEMVRVREWVKRLIAVEGEKGKGRRWIDLGRPQSFQSPLLCRPYLVTTNSEDNQRSNLRMKAGEVTGDT